jgi:DDE superfamily endonuclease
MPAPTTAPVAMTTTANTIATAAALERRRRVRKVAVALTAMFAAAAVHQYYVSNFSKTPRHTSGHTGRRWMRELLSGHSSQIKDNLGLSKEGFLHLESLLVRKSNLRDTRYMDTTEQLGVFLHAVVTDLSMKKLAERFQRSTETINRTYHKVMNHLLRPQFYRSFVKFPTGHGPLPDWIKDDNGFFPYFKDCIGVLDAHHIPVSPPENERAAFRNRKGFLSQNVLAACDFDLKFTSVLSGWEGCVSSGRLWMEGRKTGALPVPEGKYLLGDASFPNCDACLTPYRGVRYHLKEWAEGNPRPQNKEELFNLCHSKLRNVIDQTFRAIKSKYKILTKPRAFQMEAQSRVVPALCVLHNILVDIKETDPGTIAEDAGDTDSGINQEYQGYAVTAQESQRVVAKRDEIATAMWNNYLTRTWISEVTM